LIAGISGIDDARHTGGFGQPEVTIGKSAIIEVYALQRQSWRLLTLISAGKIRSAPIS